VQSEWLQARYAAQQDDQHYDQLQALEMDDSQVYALVFSVDALIPALYLKISKGSRPTFIDSVRRSALQRFQRSIFSEPILLRSALKRLEPITLARARFHAAPLIFGNAACH